MLDTLNRVTAQLVNLTPHNLDVRGVDGTTTQIPPSGKVARIEVQDTEVCIINGILVSRSVRGEVQDLPAPKNGVFYIVSLAVRDAVRDRQDVLSPGNLLRGPDGQPTGCDGLRIN